MDNFVFGFIVASIVWLIVLRISLRLCIRYERDKCAEICEQVMPHDAIFSKPGALVATQIATQIRARNYG